MSAGGDSGPYRRSLPVVAYGPLAICHLCAYRIRWAACALILEDSDPITGEGDCAKRNPDKRCRYYRPSLWANLSAKLRRP